MIKQTQSYIWLTMFIQLKVFNQNGRKKLIKLEFYWRRSQKKIDQSEALVSRQTNKYYMTE